MDKTQLKEIMREVEICMMTTLKDKSSLHSRPMRNNSEVNEDGTTYFFTTADTQTVEDINTCNSVSLTYQKGKDIFIQLFGKGEVTSDKAEIKDKWKPEVEKWFENGLETEGLRLIKVKAEFIEYWENDKSEKVEY